MLKEVKHLSKGYRRARRDRASTLSRMNEVQQELKKSQQDLEKLSEWKSSAGKLIEDTKKQFADLYKFITDGGAVLVGSKFGTKRHKKHSQERPRSKSARKSDHRKSPRKSKSARKTRQKRSPRSRVRTAEPEACEQVRSRRRSSYRRPWERPWRQSARGQHSRRSDKPVRPPRSRSQLRRAASSDIDPLSYTDIHLDVERRERSPRRRCSPRKKGRPGTPRKGRSTMLLGRDKPNILTVALPTARIEAEMSPTEQAMDKLRGTIDGLQHVMSRFAL